MHKNLRPLNLCIHCGHQFGPLKNILQGANDIMSMLVASPCVCGVFMLLSVLYLVKQSVTNRYKQLWDKLRLHNYCRKFDLKMNSNKTNTSFLQSECSHKVIEKRRRDRINTSLGELSQLLPAQSNGKQVLL